MKTLKRLVALLFVLCMALPAWAQSGPRALILYDAPPGQTFTKLGFAYAIMLRNLLGISTARSTWCPCRTTRPGR